MSLLYAYLNLITNIFFIFTSETRVLLPVNKLQICIGIPNKIGPNKCCRLRKTYYLNIISDLTSFEWLFFNAHNAHSITIR